MPRKPSERTFHATVQALTAQPSAHAGCGFKRGDVLRLEWDITNGVRGTVFVYSGDELVWTYCHSDNIELDGQQL